MAEDETLHIRCPICGEQLAYSAASYRSDPRTRLICAGCGAKVAPGPDTAGAMEAAFRKVIPRSAK